MRTGKSDEKSADLKQALLNPTENESENQTYTHLDFEGGEADNEIEQSLIELINRPAKKMKVGIVGYGPSGCTTAIGLSRQGHDVTIFEKSFYNYKDKNDESSLDRTLMYPLNIGGKGLKVIDWLRCMPIFKHHLNEFDGMKDEGGTWIPMKEARPSFISTHLEAMWAFHHSLEVCAPDVKVYQRCAVAKVDCENTTITIEDGENPGTHQFDLIIGCDGAGSIVRKCMEEQIKDFEVKKVAGEFYIKSCYFDNKEKVKQYLNPRESAIRNMMGGYPLIVAPNKFENNETACGVFIHQKGDPKNKEEARRLLSSIHPQANEMITDKGLDLFIASKPRNVFKTVYCNRFHNGSNMVIMGDAAHPFPPQGQGINIAMLDAMWLCEYIEQNPNNIGRALDMFTQKSQHQSRPLVDITLTVVGKLWAMPRELLCSQLGLIDCAAPMEWKKHDTDYRYTWGLWNSSHQALALMFKLFLFLHIVTTIALGSEWLEGVKIFGTNFFLMLSICFYYISTNKLTGTKLYPPMTIMFLAACGVAYSLKSVQKLIYPPDE